MNSNDHSITTDLNAVALDVRRRFGALSVMQLNWRAAAGSWSVAQCLEHLILTTDDYLTDFRAIAAGTRRASRWERFSPLSGFFGTVLREHLTKDAKRTKTLTRFVPPREIAGDIVARFVRNQEELLDAIRATSAADWKRTIVTSSFQSIVTYSLGDAYRIMLEHQRRHIRQADRVMATTAFPRA